MKRVLLNLCLLIPSIAFGQNAAEQRIVSYSDSLNHHPTALNYIIRGQAYKELGNYPKAIQDFNIAIRLTPNDPGIYNERGFCYLYGGNPDSAETDYTKAIELDNNNVLAYNGRGIAHFNHDDPDAAITDFTMANQLNSNFALYDRGNAYIAKGDYDSANTDLKIVITKDTLNGVSSWAYASYLLSLVYSRDFGTAEKEYKIYKRKKINSYLDWGDLNYLKTYLSICTTDLKSYNYQAGLSALDNLTKTGYKLPVFTFLNSQIKGSYAEILATKAWVYEKMDSLDKALENYKNAALLNIHNNSFSENIQRLKRLISQRNEQDKTPPSIVLFSPQPVGENITAQIDAAGNLFITGKATDPTGISEIKVNDVLVNEVDDGGNFRQLVKLNTGLLTISAKDKKGNPASKVYHIKNREIIANTGLIDIQPDDIGKYYAVFIACSKYTVPGLDTLPTVREANAVRKILEEKYNFSKENVDTIYNGDRSSILTNLKVWMDKVGPNDNLVIYYAGHGTWDPVTEIAYWIPLNTKNQFDYISNSQITDLLNSSKAKHILIMADACFSGALRSGLGTPSYYEFKLRSRQLLTSGGIARVPGKSVFAKAVVDALDASKEPFLSATELFNLIFDPVKNASHSDATIPTLRNLQVNDSNIGQFYFQKKQ